MFKILIIKNHTIANPTTIDIEINIYLYIEVRSVLKYFAVRTRHRCEGEIRIPKKRETYPTIELNKRFSGGLIIIIKGITIPTAA